MNFRDMWPWYKVTVYRLEFTRPDPEKYQECWLMHPLPPITFEEQCGDLVDLHYLIKKHIPGYESTVEVDPCRFIMFTGYSLEEIKRTA
jgi:hypothetical protein